MSDLYWPTGAQMARLMPFFPKPHGKPRVDDRRVLSGVIFINRNDLRWRDVPAEYDPHKTSIVVGSDGARKASSHGCCSNWPPKAGRPTR